jgi:hypothetical protein
VVENLGIILSVNTSYYVKRILNTNNFHPGNKEKLADNKKGCSINIKIANSSRCILPKNSKKKCLNGSNNHKD